MPISWETERVHECLCKLGGRGHEAEVSAGEVDNLAAQLPRQHPVRLVWQLVLGVTSPGEHDPLGERLERSEIKLNPWILAQLVLHPVRGIGLGVLVRVLAHRAMHQLVVYASKCPAGKLVHGFRNPLLPVGVVDPVEKGQPFRRIGQQ